MYNAIPDVLEPFLNRFLIYFLSKQNAHWFVNYQYLYCGIIDIECLMEILFTNEKCSCFVWVCNFLSIQFHHPAIQRFFLKAEQQQKYALIENDLFELSKKLEQHHRFPLYKTKHIGIHYTYICICNMYVSVSENVEIQNENAMS